MKLEKPSGLARETPKEIPTLFEAVISEQPQLETEAPPMELCKFRMLSDFDKAKAGPEFYFKDHIKDYLERKWKRELHNDTGFWWLLKLKEDTEDEDQLAAIGSRLKVFAKVINETKNPYRVFKKDVSRYL